MRSDRDDLSDVISDDTKSAPSRRGEVLVGPERRRRWPLAKKLAIVKESFEEGAVVSHVAQRHGLSPQQLFGWRREIRDLVLASPGLEGAGPSSEVDFVPIAVAETPAVQAVALEKTAGDAGPAEIEVELPGATVRLRGSVDGKALMAVLTALKVLR
jgi:transposase